MLDWVEAGVRSSLTTYARLRGVPLPTRLPFIGPRKVPTRRTISSVEIDSGATFDGIEFVVESPYWSTGVGNQEFGAPVDNVTFRDCVFTGATKWASRSYRTRRNWRFINCAFRTTWPEHDVYHNIAGYNVGDLGWTNEPSMVFASCYFEDTGSQNLQLVQRSNPDGPDDWYGETAPEDLTPGGPIAVIDCLSRNAGFGLDHPRGMEGKPYEGDPRPAFALSFFQARCDVYVRRSMIDKTMQTRSSGCLLSEGIVPQAGPGRVRRTVIEGSVFMVGEATQPLALIRDNSEVRIRSSWFSARSGQSVIEFSNTRRYLIEGCTGNASVMRNRTLHGPITQRHEYAST